eukprot:2801027-Lingulodinium_polyedra.AAC.1
MAANTRKRNAPRTANTREDKRANTNTPRTANANTANAVYRSTKLAAQDARVVHSRMPRPMRNRLVDAFVEDVLRCCQRQQVRLHQVGGI